MSQSASSTATKSSLAILDDYFDFASKHFTHIIPQLSAFSTYPFTINAQKNPDALVDRLHRYDIILSMRERTVFSRSILERLPNLKFLLTTGTRNNSIDTAACKDLGITLTGTTGKYVTIKADGFDNTSEHCWALILSLAKGIPRDDNLVKFGPAATWQLRPNISLAGRTFAVLGLGKLGSNVARTAVLGFGMRVIAWSSSLTQEKADEQATKKGLPAGSIEVVGSKIELFRRADVLSVQYVLSDRSRGLVGKADFDVMKPDAIFINTSRGPIVQEDALVNALMEGKIRGAALDVFDEEPLPEDNVWRRNADLWGKDGRGELVLTPHMAYGVQDMYESWYREQAEDVERWLKGEELMDKWA